MTKVAFLIPSTTNKRDEWTSAQDTYLWNILCETLERYTPDHQIKLFIGYDSTDRIYSLAEERLKFRARFMNFNLEWFPQIHKKGKVTAIWNSLACEALKQDYDYLKVLGDDIRMPNDSSWLGCFINKLKKNQNIGWSGGWSNNDAIATQFLVHRKHFDIFGFIYPNEIANWTCDDWLFQIYPEKYRNWMKQYPLLNVGGSPRYEIQFSEKFLNAIIRRYKPTLNRFLQNMDK